MNKKTDEEFVDAVAKVLDMNHDEKNQEQNDLNDRLALMRKHALDQIPDAERNTKPGFLKPAIGFATIALVAAVGLSIYNPEQGFQEDLNIALNELDILTESEDIEMLEMADIEFYVWLESMPEEDKS